MKPKIYYTIKNINDVKIKEIEAFYSKLNINEQEHLKKIMNKKKKLQSIIGKILLNELLQEKYNSNYFKEIFCFNINGKPYFKNKNIYFNISHSNDYVVCAISNTPIGIDIEKKRPINNKHLKWFATQKEIEYIANDNEKALKIYTLKEAYFKMKGENLNNILNISFRANSCSDKSVKFKTTKRIPGYIISIVYKKNT